MNLRSSTRPSGRLSPLKVMALTTVMAVLVAACNTKPNDYDGDKKADVVYIAGGAWVQDGVATPLWSGLDTDVNVGGDYDNDGKWEPAELQGRDWYSSKLASPIHYDPVGLPTATPDWPNGAPAIGGSILPVPADYDGDGKTDPAYYAVVDGTWWISGRNGFTQYGTPPTHTGAMDWDVPVPGDYDGDRKADLAVFHPADHSFRILQSKTGTERIVRFPSTAALMPVPADYDGNGTVDPAVADVTGTTWWLTPNTPTPTYVFGSPTAAADNYPVVADYDGDKKADPAVYDAANHRVRALIAGAEITLATIPSNASVVPAFPYALRANYHRLYFLGLCLVGRYSTSANPPIPRSQMCPPPPVAFDFDGDQTADIAWTDASGAWNRLGGTSPFFTGPQYSARAPGDYDGSGAWEPTAIDQPADTPIWITPTQSIPYALPSFTIAHYPDWYGGGSVGNPILPVPGRYDGFDHRTLPAYYVIASGKWYVEGHPTVTLGTTPAADGDLGWDVPVPGDYRGAGRDDFVVYRPTDSTFRGWLGTAIQVGQPGDRPAPADYDGNGTVDPATYHPSTGEWFIAGQPTRSLAPAVDHPEDWVPIPADYDGDGKADLALFNLVDRRWVIDGRGVVATLGSSQWPIEYTRVMEGSMARLQAFDHCLHDPTWATLYPGHCPGAPT